MNVVWDGFLYSDGVGKAITAALLVLNAGLWSLIIAKFLQVRSQRRGVNAMQKRLEKYGSCTHKILGDLDRDSSLQGPLAEMGRAASKLLLEILKPSAQQKYAFFSEGTLPRPLTEQELERVQVAIETEITSQRGALEASLPVVATIITLGPMFGLFGTVWGVMATFVGIVNNGGRPDIQAIAPGIAGALLTTVAGLFVAIPGTLCNNQIVTNVEGINQQMDDFRDALLTSLQLAKTAQQPRTAMAAAPQACADNSAARTACPQSVVQPAMMAPSQSFVSRDGAVEISVSEDPEGGSPDGYAR